MLAAEPPAEAARFDRRDSRKGRPLVDLIQGLPLPCVDEDPAALLAADEKRRNIAATALVPWQTAGRGPFEFFFLGPRGGKNRVRKTQCPLSTR